MQTPARTHTKTRTLMHTIIPSKAAYVCTHAHTHKHLPAPCTQGHTHKHTHIAHTGMAGADGIPAWAFGLSHSVKIIFLSAPSPMLTLPL